MLPSWFVRGLLSTLLPISVVLGGCSWRSTTRAPVEDRGAQVQTPVVPVVPAAPKQAPGFENAGKPGYYTVKPGDTLIRIGLDTGQSWHDIARWNAIDNPHLIEVGQVLRVAPPAEVATAHAVPVPSAPSTHTTALPSVSSAKTATASVSGTSASVSTSVASSTASAAPAAAGEELDWIWPAQGPVIAGYDESRNKGLDIGGKAGDPVLAAADGYVVFADGVVRGYGKLIILKHNNTYLSAYAHNQTVLVKETQSVKRGQKIAEMGNSDADRVKLHFEIRRLGQPMDPAKLLPAR